MYYRRATINDIPCLIEFRKQQLIDEGFPPIANIDLELREYFLSGLSDGSFISWLAVDKSSVVATSGLCFYQLPPSYSNPTGRVAYVTNMFTKKEYRRQGISSHLLSLIMDEIRRRDYKVIRLHASIDGKAMYREAGFIDSDGYMTLVV
jgi:GNAT superfamily N-acetyltransferase